MPSRNEQTPRPFLRDVELENPTNGVHLAGALEVGGSMSFNTTHSTIKGVTYMYVNPEISITDNDHGRVDKFHDLYGGREPKPLKNSWRWRIAGRGAYDLLESIEPFAPSRHDFIQAARLCYEHDLSIEQKISIIEELKTGGDNSERFSHVSPSDYEQLVQDPQFVAGAIDARGTISSRERWAETANPHGITAPAVTLITQNGVLLEALRLRHGGSIIQKHTKGEQEIMMGHDVTVRNDSYRWQLLTNDAQTFLATIGPHLLVREAA